MTPTTLRSVTLKTVANYRHAAEHAVVAYRTGGHRLLAVILRGLDRAATQGAGRYAPGLAAALQRANGSVGSLAGKGLDKFSSGTERVIAAGSDGVKAQLARVADLAKGVDNETVANGLQAVARLSLPGAQAALALSKKVAEGADKLSTAAAGRAAARTKARQAARRSAAAGDQAGRAATKVAKAVRRGAVDVQAETVTAVKRVARSVKPAVAEVAAVPAPQAVARKAKAKVKTAPKAPAVRTRRSAAKVKVFAANGAQDQAGNPGV